VALLQHAAEAALARRAPREAAVGLKGFADALKLAGAGAVPRRVEALARAAALRLSAQDAAGARADLDEALALAEQASLDSPELWLVQARVLRSEARRARAAESLGKAEAAGVPALAALVAVERAESLEQEGDLVNAMVAFESALVSAEAAGGLARWHGEVDLVARAEARLAALSLQQKDLPTARRLFESSAGRWRAANYPAGEARALSNLGATCAVAKDLSAAMKCFTSAAEAAAGSGDFLFQARALLQLAKAQKKHEPAGTGAKASATDARRLAVALGWEQGRLEATALIEG
jgi:tetratricopeptide (TPR) repeat protein